MNRLLNSVQAIRMLLLIVSVGAVVLAVSIFYRYSYQQRQGEELLKNQAAWTLETIIQVSERELVSAANAEQTFSEELKAKFQLAVKIVENSSRASLYLDSIKERASFDLFWVNKKADQIKSFLDKNDLQSYSILETFSIASNHPGAVYWIELTSVNRPTHIGLVTFSESNDYILASVSSDRLLKSGQTIGFGQYLKQFQKAQGIEYIVLQDKSRIIAGSLNNYNLTSFQTDSLLLKAMDSDSMIVRSVRYNDKDIIEAIGLFKVDLDKIGVFRCGFSTSVLKEQESKFLNRLIILGVILLLFVVIIIFLFKAYRQREKLEMLVSDLNEYSNHVLNRIDSGVVTFDETGKIKLFTEQAGKLLDIKTENPNLSNLPVAIVKEVDKILKSNKIEDINKTYTFWGRGDSELLSFQFNNLPKVESNNQFALLINDITVQHKHELQKQQSEKLEAITKLGAIVAHEIRNPLNAMKLTLSNMLRLKKNDDSDDSLSRITTINNEIDRIDSLVEDFVQYTQPQKTRLEDVSIPELFNDLKILYEGHKDKSGLKLTFESEPSLTIPGDVRQLKQMFINLINNSIDACSDEGIINITAESDDNGVILSVKDNGPGIEKDKLDRIFDLYYTSKNSGNGIGLAVVNQIVANHKGTVDVKSSPESGTSFEIKIGTAKK